MNPSRLIINVIISFALLVGAIVQAAQGDLEMATFLAVIWVGYSNNTSQYVTGFYTRAIAEGRTVRR